jgi:hypothetical protein
VTRSGTESVAQATPLTTLGTNGMSQWSYRDLSDSVAKTEGGYAPYGGTSGYYADPHGGYDTTTNKCKVCHAVHRAEGAYYLLRADSQDDACDYCHIGGAAHSSKVVYDFGKYTTNGHTIGAQTQIPDSTVAQWAEAVVLSTTDAGGSVLSEVINVRAYDEAKLSMYRFSRHHGHSPVGTGRSGYIKVGPLALRCMSCHQVHNATNEVWRPRVLNTDSGTTYAGWYDGDFASAGYKLLKRYPSGTTSGAANAFGYYDAPTAVKVIESSATAGVNFSQASSMAFTYAENGVTRTAPVWIAQDIHAGEDGAAAPYRYPASVNQFATSYWCADCHNLNLGGWEALDNPELGFRAHTERTHPAPFYGAYGGPGQCYSCHRNDLPQKLGETNVVAGGTAPSSIAGTNRDGCTQCHFGTADYKVATQAASYDFPHSGDPATAFKLLGGYSVDIENNAPTTIKTATIGSGNLDAVCLRCHGGIGVNH